MPESMTAAELSALVSRVFQPTPDDTRLGVMIDLPDAKVPDDAAWAARRRSLRFWRNWRSAIPSTRSAFTLSATRWAPAMR